MVTCVSCHPNESIYCRGPVMLLCSFDEFKCAWPTAFDNAVAFVGVGPLRFSVILMVVLDPSLWFRWASTSVEALYRLSSDPDILRKKSGH